MSLRARLIFGYSLLVTAIVTLFGIGLFLFLRDNLTQQIDQALEESASDILGHGQAQRVEDLRLLSLPPLFFPSANTYIQIWDASGKLVTASPNLTSVSEPLDPNNIPVPIEKFTDNMVEGIHLRVLSESILIGGKSAGVLEVGTPLTVVDRALDFLIILLLAGGGFSIGLSILLGNWIARSALRPIETITASALQITHADDLSRRIPMEASPGSEVGRLIQAFNETLERLEKLFTTQSRFLADISHELRTPLTAVRGNVDLLRKMGADPESLDAVQSETDRMIRLVGDLLVLSRAESGTLPLAHEPVEVDTLLLEVFQQGRILAQGKVGISVGFLDQAVVIGDRDRLKQLLLNLVANAVQYTPSGGSVVLSLRIVEDCVHLTVADTGPGIPPADLPHIFDRFYRSEKSRSRIATGGAGLGLSIAQWIAQGHGGRIEVASELGKGTTFSVWLPFERRPVRPASPAKSV